MEFSEQHHIFLLQSVWQLRRDLRLMDHSPNGPVRRGLGERDVSINYLHFCHERRPFSVEHSLARVLRAPTFSTTTEADSANCCTVHTGAYVIPRQHDGVELDSS